MRALITGGAGFIGSHLAERLLQDGHQVTVLDDLSTGSIDNIKHLRQHDRFEYHLESIFNRPILAELVDACDVVFHLAAAVGVRNIVESPVRTIETNVGGSELVLQMASKKRKRFVITSTSEVYGKSTSFPFSEDDDLVLGPTNVGRWSYACSKALDEFLALAYFHERRVPVTVLRLFNTVGPRQTGRYGMVLPTFVGQALRNEPVTVFGTGEQSRCFAHVSDVVNGIVACATSSKTIGHVFNLGNTEEISINELAAKVISMSDSSSEIVHLTYEEAYGEGFEDMARRVPDLRKAGKFFGYCPKKSLDDIISSVIDYVRDGGRVNRTVPLAA
ncbi:MAG: GDP-mannose 4,6-dehydratase [Candidatus Korobacteraceae bacterium]|jgi:UDP-glucose 4-epimerase